MTAEELIELVREREVETGAITQAVKREWGGKGVDSSEPYLTNGAWRAGVAVVNEIERLLAVASTRERRDA